MTSGVCCRRSVRLTPENTWGLLHAVLGLGFAVWWQVSNHSRHLSNCSRINLLRWLLGYLALCSGGEKLDCRLDGWTPKVKDKGKILRLKRSGLEDRLLTARLGHFGLYDDIRTFGRSAPSLPADMDGCASAIALSCCRGLLACRAKMGIA